MRKHTNNKRSAPGLRAGLLVLMAVLLLGGAVGGTLAYFTDTDTAVNTMVVGAVGELKLEKTGEAPVVPGTELVWDYTLTYTPVQDRSIPVYIFVGLKGWDCNEQTGVLSTGTPGASFALNSGWAYVTTENGEAVFARKLGADEALTDTLIEGGKIAVDYNAAAELGWDSFVEDTMGRLSVTAYAIQAEGFADAAAAWDAVN